MINTHFYCVSKSKWLQYGGGIQWWNGIGNVTSIKNFLAAATQLNIRLGLITYHYPGQGTLHSNLHTTELGRFY